MEVVITLTLGFVAVCSFIVANEGRFDEKRKISETKKKKSR